MDILAIPRQSICCVSSCILEMAMDPSIVAERLKVNSMGRSTADTST